MTENSFNDVKQNNNPGKKTIRKQIYLFPFLNIFQLIIENCLSISDKNGSEIESGLKEHNISAELPSTFLRLLPKADHGVPYSFTLLLIVFLNHLCMKTRFMIPLTFAISRPASMLPFLNKRCMYMVYHKRCLVYGVPRATINLFLFKTLYLSLLLNQFLGTA